MRRNGSSEKRTHSLSTGACLLIHGAISFVVKIPKLCRIHMHPLSIRDDAFQWLILAIALTQWMKDLQTSGAVRAARHGNTHLTRWFNQTLKIASVRVRVKRNEDEFVNCVNCIQACWHKKSGGRMGHCRYVGRLRQRVWKTPSREKKRLDLWF